MYIVADTNIVISALLFPKSLPSQAIIRGMIDYKLAVSMQVHTEYLEVLARDKFNPYIGLDQRMLALENILKKSESFLPIEEIKASRDPKDDMFLELAVTAKAACIISGDPHLLELHPFRGIPILNAADFLKSF